jgi:hypothetical protein
VAYQHDFLDEDKNQQQGNPGQTLAGATSVVSPQGGGQASQAPDANKKTSSGSWTNLFDYVNANSGNDAKMGQAIGQNIEQRAGQAQNQAQSFADTTTQKVEAATVKDQGIIDAVSQNPNQVARDAEQRKQFDAQWDAQYRGPNQAQDVEGFGQTANQFAQVQDRANQAQSHGGRKTLLNDEYGRQDYTQGQKTLDSFILGAGEQGRQTLADINQNYGQFTQGWDELLGNLGQTIDQGRQTTEQTRNDTRNAVTSQISNYDNTFTERNAQLEAEMAQWDANRKALAENLAKKQNLDRLGLDRNTADYLTQHGLNLNSLYDASTAKKLGDYVSEDEQMAYESLFDLARAKGSETYNDFSRSGLSENDYIRLNTDAINAGKNLTGLNSTLQNQVQAANQAKANQYQQAVQALDGIGLVGVDRAPILSQLGISEAEYDRAKQAGINFQDYLKQTGNLSVGDLASTQQRNSWEQLLATLKGVDQGFTGKSIGTATGNPTQAFTFNADAFRQALPPDPALAQVAGPAGSGKTYIEDRIESVPDAIPAPIKRWF